MNFLAHAHLSGNDKLVLLGNFTADSVKGSDFLRYPERVKQGILLHRFIDTYTDTHPVVAETKKRLRPLVGKYAPVVADVFYDHFLARYWEHYHPHEKLSIFAGSVYQTLQAHSELLPERSKDMLPYMEKQNWLLSYASIEGISDVLERMARRARFESGMEKAGKELERNFELYHKEFSLFFPELEENTAKKRLELTHFL